MGETVTKQIIRKTLERGLVIDNKSIEQAIDILSKFDKNAVLDFCCGYDGDVDIDIVLEREETDDEYANRLRDIELYNQREQERKYAQYLKLKSIYEKEK